jgi:hypothetical protein
MHILKAGCSRLFIEQLYTKNGGDAREAGVSLPKYKHTNLAA